MKTKKHIFKPITDKRTKEIFSLLKQAEQCADDLENIRKKLAKDLETERKKLTKKK